MSDSISDLPKYPGESEEARAKLFAVLRSDLPAEPEPLWVRVRHALPGVLLIAAVVFALVVSAGLAIILSVGAMKAGQAEAVVLFGAFLALTVVAVASACYQRHRNRQRQEKT